MIRLHTLRRLKYHPIYMLGIIKLSTVFCPFKLTREFLLIRGDYESELEPFFRLKDGSPVKPSMVRCFLRSVIARLNLRSELYDCQSFRAGRTIDLFKLGYNVEIIKRIGRWRSNAVYQYLKAM